MTINGKSANIWFDECGEICESFFNDLKNSYEEKHKGGSMATFARLDYGYGIYRNPESTIQKVKIEKVSNGFIVKVGCKTFVETTWDKVSKALDLYWKDPAKAEKRYCK